MRITHTQAAGITAVWTPLPAQQPLTCGLVRRKTKGMTCLCKASTARMPASASLLPRLEYLAACGSSGQAGARLNLSGPTVRRDTKGGATLRPWGRAQRSFAARAPKACTEGEKEANAWALQPNLCLHQRRRVQGLLLGGAVITKTPNFDSKPWSPGQPCTHLQSLAVTRVELFFCPQEARHEEVKQRPQLQHIVLDGST